MFKWEPITTTNILTVIQMIIVGLGFFLSYRSLRVAIENAQAQLYNQLIVQGRELQLKQWEIFADPDENKAALVNRSNLIGMILGYFSGAFELRRVIDMPASTQKLMDAELKELMSEVAFRQKWEQIRHMYSKEFNEHMDSIRGV